MKRPSVEYMQEMLQALLDLEEGLTIWEVTFVDSIDKQLRTNLAKDAPIPNRAFSHLTDRQVEVMVKIYEEKT